MEIVLQMYSRIIQASQIHCSETNLSKLKVVGLLLHKEMEIYNLPVKFIAWTLFLLYKLKVSNCYCFSSFTYN